MNFRVIQSWKIFDSSQFSARFVYQFQSSRRRNYTVAMWSSQQWHPKQRDAISIIRSVLVGMIHTKKKKRRHWDKWMLWVRWILWWKIMYRKSILCLCPTTEIIIYFQALFSLLRRPHITSHRDTMYNVLICDRILSTMYNFFLSLSFYRDRKRKSCNFVV